MNMEMILDQLVKIVLVILAKIIQDHIYRKYSELIIVAFNYSHYIMFSILLYLNFIVT